MRINVWEKETNKSDIADKATLKAFQLKNCSKLTSQISHFDVY